MSRIYDVTAIIGKYTDRDGNEKSRYLTIGAVIETKTGKMLKLDAIPVGWEGFAYLNEPRAREETPQRRPASARSSAADDSDVPFAQIGKGRECLAM